MGALSVSGVEPLAVLLVEDDRDDIDLLQMACRRAGANFNWYCVSSVQEAVAYLDAIAGGNAPESGAALPAMIILDIMLPAGDGFELLTYVRAHPALQHLPVIVLTGNDDPNVRAMADQCGATAFFCKPMQKAQAATLYRSIGRSVDPASPERPAIPSPPGQNAESSAPAPSASLETGPEAAA